MGVAGSPKLFEFSVFSTAEQLRTALLGLRESLKESLRGKNSHPTNTRVWAQKDLWSTVDFAI